jgi:hypothetical protein
LSAKFTNHVRAHVMYIPMYMGLMRALYTAMYVRARQSRAVSPSAFNNRPMFSVRHDLRAGVRKNAGRDVVNLVPQCPALVPPSLGTKPTTGAVRDWLAQPRQLCLSCIARYRFAGERLRMIEHHVQRSVSEGAHAFIVQFH